MTYKLPIDTEAPRPKSSVPEMEAARVRNWQVVSGQMDGADFMRTIPAPTEAAAFVDEVQLLAALEQQTQDRSEQTQIMKAVPTMSADSEALKEPAVFALPEGIQVAFKFANYDAQKIFAETDDSLRARIDTILAASGFEKNSIVRKMIEGFKGASLEQYGLTVHVMRKYCSEEYVKNALGALVIGCGACPC
jgi:hypothetical protein